MRYRLVVVSHGIAPHLDETLASFDEMVSPAPAARALILDGHGARHPGGEWDATVRHVTQLGFGAAMRSGWRHARQSPEPYVFWLENDFRFDRPIDLTDCAAALLTNVHLAQVALVRGAVNARERRAGGWPGLHGPWAQRELWRDTGPVRWRESRWGWTTNPSLIPTSFIRQHDWPDGAESEGRFALAVKATDDRAMFGVLGWADEHVTHLGERDGIGY